MIRTSLILFLALLFNDVFGQVPQKAIAEHFTNTRCSICGRKNPDFFTNLNNNPSVLHMSVHPSSPYASCVLNQHNVSENDARTRYYNIYGATPRVVVQGKVLGTSTDLSSPSIFAAALGKMSPIEINISQQRKGSDSLQVDVIVKAVAVHALDSQQLFAAILEDTIFYSAPNGENTHYNVFRKALFGAEGQRFFPPANGDSISFSACVKYHSNWDKQRVYPLVIVQESAGKGIVQAENAAPLGPMSTITPGIGKQMKLYPNPAKSSVFLELAEEKETSFYLYDALGKVQKSFTLLGSARISLTDLAPGIYFLESDQSQDKIKLIVR